MYNEAHSPKLRYVMIKSILKTALLRSRHNPVNRNISQFGWLQLITGLMIIFTIAACGGGDNDGAASGADSDVELLKINNFSATDETIDEGGSVTLNWSVDNATSVTISPAIGAVDATGNLAISPTVTTTFTLVASNGQETLEQSVLVTVVTSPTISVVEFSVSENEIEEGGSTSLSWRVENASNITISPDIGAVDAIGNTLVSPTVSTTYILTASNGITSLERSVSVTVTGSQSSIQIIEFTVTENEIEEGGSTSLSWRVENASNITISPDIGEVESVDSLLISPTVTTTYTITASDGDDSLQQTVLVTVYPSSNLIKHVTNGSESITLNLTPYNVRGNNFEVLEQNEDGEFESYSPSSITHTYIGGVSEYPDAVAVGMNLADGSFKGAVYFARGLTWNIVENEVAEVLGTQQQYFELQSETVNTGHNDIGLVYQFDQAVDITYKLYLNKYQENTDKALEMIEYSLLKLNGIYIRDTLVEARLARVIIRTSSAHDPYLNVENTGELLGLVREEWATNQSDADRDIATAVGTDICCGTAYILKAFNTDEGVNAVFARDDGTFDENLRHENAHNFTARGDYYKQINPSPEGDTIMSWNLYSRFAGQTVESFLDTRDNLADAMQNIGNFAVNFPPYAALDFVQLSAGGAVTIDVLANDHDANGHSLTIQTHDNNSMLDATIQQNANELFIQMSADPQGELDHFFYTIEDSSGQIAIGVVMIEII